MKITNIFKADIFSAIIMHQAAYGSEPLEKSNISKRFPPMLSIEGRSLFMEMHRIASETLHIMWSSQLGKGKTLGRRLEKEAGGFCLWEALYLMGQQCHAGSSILVQGLQDLNSSCSSMMFSQ